MSKASKVIQFGQPQGAIDVAAVMSNNKKLRFGLISPAVESTDTILAAEHTSEPIKSLDDIERISRYLIENKRYRDNMLFIVGINFGLRVSDLRLLRFSNLITDTMVFKDSFPVFEVKTRNTRTHKKNRHITINDAVRDAVILYLENTPGVSLSDYMFKSEAYHKGTKDDPNENQPMHRNSIDRILKGIAKDLDLTMKISTHTLRKTFAYHQMVMSNNDHRKLLLLQKMMGHSTAAQTLDYIGITGEEIEEAYRKLNLGSTTKNYLIDSNVVELDTAAV